MIKMPSAFQVSECVRKLTRRKTETTVLVKPSPTVKLPYGGTFHGGDRTLVAMCAADLHFAALTSAALSLIPVESAQERIKSGALDEMLEENFAEVLNVLARIYVVPETARMTLLEAIFPPRSMPATIPTDVVGAVVLRTDFRIEIDSYGIGHLALWGLA